jgi:hypothetical protein
MMNRTVRFLTSAALGLFVASGAGVALADEPAAPPADGAAAPAGDAAAPAPAAAPAAAVAGTDYNSRGLTPHMGGLAVYGALNINLSKSAVAKPVWITPNVYYGISDQLAVGVATNVFAETWDFVTPLRGGLCLGGNDRGCAKAFNNISLDGLFSFMKQPGTEIAAHGGLDFAPIDPLYMQLRLGVRGKVGGGPIAVVFDPALSIGLTKRSEGNKEAINVPVRVGFQASPELNVGVATGIGGPTSHFGDLYYVPLAFSGLFGVAPNIDVGAHFSFVNLLGKNHSADFRELGLFLNFRT